MSLDAIKNINQQDMNIIREFFNNKRDEVINLVNDYLDKNCVNFKKNGQKSYFKREIETKFEALAGIIQNEVNDGTVVNEVNYSYSQSQSRENPSMSSSGSREFLPSQDASI